MKEVLAIAGVCLAIVAFTALLLFGGPVYFVWKAGKSGEATLMRAEHEKKVMVEQARAEVEAAKLRAEAIATIGKAAKEYPEYRHQEFVGAFGEALSKGNISQIIYVPTEANIPITEAGRLQQ